MKKAKTHTDLINDQLAKALATIIPGMTAFGSNGEDLLTEEEFAQKEARFKRKPNVTKLADRE